MEQLFAGYVVHVTDAFTFEIDLGNRNFLNVSNTMSSTYIFSENGVEHIGVCYKCKLYLQGRHKYNLNTINWEAKNFINKTNGRVWVYVRGNDNNSRMLVSIFDPVDGQSITNYYK